MAGSLADPGPILGRAAANAAAVKLIVVFLHLIESAAGSARDTSHPARPTSSLTSDGIAALRLSVERIQATRCGSVELDALITEVLRCASASDLGDTARASDRIVGGRALVDRPRRRACRDLCG